MSTRIPEDLVRTLRDRRTLLWVCQRYDLRSGEEPHSLDAAFDSAVARYRHDVSGVDSKLADLYWEAIWLEGAKSPLLAAIRQALESQRAKHQRPVVVLASETDSRAQVSTKEFLPAFVLPGVLDTAAAPDARYGTTKARQRDRVSWALKQRLSAFPGRLLVVLGAASPSDLDSLYEALEDAPIVNLRLLIQWSDSATDPPISGNPAIRSEVWHGSPAEFAVALLGAGVPTSSDLPQWAVRVGSGTVVLGAPDVRRVVDQYALIVERDLLPVDSFSQTDLFDFLNGKLDSWAAFSAGVPIARSYKSAIGLSLPEEMIAALERVAREDGSPLSAVVRLPCEPGAGATTLIREAAYRAAQAGFPSLVLRPSQTHLDFEELTAFSTRISEAALSQGIRDTVKLFIALDVEHERFVRASDVARRLASQGRSAVVLQATRNLSGNQSAGDRGGRSDLPTLTAAVDDREVLEAQTTFADAARRWKLSLEVPSIESWRAYQGSSNWRSPAANFEPTSIFWVALRFFLTDGLDSSATSTIHDALGRWISRRASRIGDPQMQRVVKIVAALSAQRIVAPMWTVLRPVTGGSFPSSLVETIKCLDDILVWDDYVEELQDQTLRFAHPALAQELLRQDGVTGQRDYTRVLRPMLESLSPGHAGDLWVAEQLATELVPSFESRAAADWDWRLEFFLELPSIVRDSSKTILHHWARALYQSVDPKYGLPLGPGDRKAQLEAAISKLRRALELPRRAGRDENPSHMLNTLGVAYSRYARCLKEEFNDGGAEETAWDAACDAFEKSLSLAGGANLDALLAFSQRLVRHAQPTLGSSVSEGALGDLSHALALIDTASELLAEFSTDDTEIAEHLTALRAEALGLLGAEHVRAFIRSLKESDQPALAYYCEARLAFKDGTDEAGRERALAVLETAERGGVNLGARARALQITLFRSDPRRRYDFQRLKDLYEALEGDPAHTPRSVDAFRHAVLCYQVGEFGDGARRFRRLREDARRSGLGPPRFRDRLSDRSDPARARELTAKVLRINTEWRADALVEEMNQVVPLRPRHFSPMPRENEIVRCAIRFEFNGPLAVPPRFEDRKNTADRKTPGHR